MIIPSGSRVVDRGHKERSPHQGVDNLKRFDKEESGTSKGKSVMIESFQSLDQLNSRVLMASWKRQVLSRGSKGERKGALHTSEEAPKDT